MKKSKLSFLEYMIILLLFLPQMIFSADIEQIINEYSGKDGFTIVNIPGSSLGYVFNEMNDENKHTSSDDKKLKEISKDITGIKILTYSKEEGGKQEPIEIYNKFLSVVNTKEYQQLMNVSKKDEKVLMLVKKDASGKVSEFLMVTYEPTGATLIQIAGKMNLSDIKELTNPNGNQNEQKQKK